MLKNQNNHSRLPSIPWHLLSGAISGLSSCVILQPFDLLKTRLQQVHIKSLNTNSYSSEKVSLPQITKQIVARDGILGLWRGTTPTVLRNVPGVALYFFTLAELRNAMSNFAIFSQPSSDLQSNPINPNLTRVILPKLSPTGDLLAGMFARSSVGFFLMPVTVIKTRFESNLYQYSTISTAFQDIIQRQGIKALWKGFLPTLLRDAPFAGIFVASYESSKRLLQPISSQPSVFHHIIPATTAAIVATLLTAPFDLIKTHLQLSSNSSTSTRSSFSSIFLILKDSLKTGHLSNSKFLFNGSGLRLIRKGLSSAIGWTIYEGLIKRWSTKP
ncbi:hypothetical protein O181_101889 [Austropuccinia psidii MF-1]|uniref:Mitochondrial glycine transporter n=1 Tax=Austropuccinia psidii MF-1 TaxID=1389203 RepID=A0A9Q3PHR4_9BASI|nr:hypothetical protein [Austropuccinia psidii MF-1]